MSSSTNLPGLKIAGAIGGLAQSLAGVQATLLASRTAGSAWAAGLPQALLVLGAAWAALVIGRLSATLGRRRALVRAAAVAVSGAALATVAAQLDNLVLLTGASLALGWGTCAVMISRYAATNVDDEHRARAIAAVLTAITVGAVAGPNLLGPAETLDRTLHVAHGTIAFVLCGIGFLSAAAVWWVRLEDEPPPPVQHRAPVMTRNEITATGVLSIANLIMVATMTMAPVQMQMHLHTGVTAVGIVVSAHIAAMFAPSPLTGRLTDRIGEPAVLGVAALTLTAATVLAAVSRASTPLLATAMVLLGLGWNFSVVAGSALLTRSADAVDRPRLEGRGEVGMGIAAAFGGASSGLVMAGAGYAGLGIAATATVIAVFVPLVLRTRHAPSRSRTEGSWA